MGHIVRAGPEDDRFQRRAGRNRIAADDVICQDAPFQRATRLAGTPLKERVFKVLDYGTMAGAKFAPNSAAKVREVEDELLAMCSA